MTTITHRKIIADGNFGDCALRGCDGLIVIGGKFGYSALQNCEYPVVSGGKFGDWALWGCEYPVVSGGEFGHMALEGCKVPVITGGKFGNDALWNCENPVVGGGQFGNGALRNCKNACVLNVTGDFKGIYTPYSGIVVARHIGRINTIVIGYSPRSEVYFVDGPEVTNGPGGISKGRIARITPKQLIGIEKSVKERMAKESFQSGLEKAVREVIGNAA